MAKPKGKKKQPILLNEAWLTPDVIDELIVKIGDIVRPPQKTSTFVENKLIQLVAIAASATPKPGGLLALVTRDGDNSELPELNATGIVILGENEEALAWLRHTFKPNFGPKSIEAVKAMATALREIFPEAPPAKAKKKPKKSKKVVKKKAKKSKKAKLKS